MQTALVRVWPRWRHISARGDADAYVRIVLMRFFSLDDHEDLTQCATSAIAVAALGTTIGVVAAVRCDGLIYDSTSQPDGNSVDQLVRGLTGNWQPRANPSAG